MITGEQLKAIQNHNQIAIRNDDGEWEILGNVNNFEMTCECGESPTINMEISQNHIYTIPNPNYPTKIVFPEIPDITQCYYNPHEAIDFGWDGIDAMRYCVEDIKNTNKYLGKKEGKDMKLLNMYVEKSEKNIKDYYQNLIEMEEKNDIVKQDYDYIVEKYKKDMKELAERYNEVNSPTGSFIIIEPAFGIESRFKVVHRTTEKEEMYYKLRDDELKQLHDKTDEINAQLEMVNMFGDENNCDYDTVQAILVEYGVINENGRLTPYTPTFVNEEAPVKEAPKKVGRPKKVSE